MKGSIQSAVSLRFAQLSVVLALTGSSSIAGPADEVAFFSKQRLLEQLGRRQPDVTVDEREGAEGAAAGRDVEVLARAVAHPETDPISPAEVEGALDPAYAPLVPRLELPAGRSEPARSETIAAKASPPGDGCGAVRGRIPTSWGLMGALDGATFTWVDGVGKLRTVKYRLSADDASVALSISVGRKMFVIDTYRKIGPGVAGFESSGGRGLGRIRLAADRFSYASPHEVGTFSLDASCNLVVSGSLRHNPRRIQDIFFNTGDGSDPVRERAVRLRAAVRVARLSKSAIVGLARHS